MAIDPIVDFGGYTSAQLAAATQPAVGFQAVGLCPVVRGRQQNLPTDPQGQQLIDLIGYVPQRDHFVFDPPKLLEVPAVPPPFEKPPNGALVLSKNAFWWNILLRGLDSGITEFVQRGLDGFSPGENALRIVPDGQLGPRVPAYVNWSGPQTFGLAILGTATADQGLAYAATHAAQMTEPIAGRVFNSTFAAAGLAIANDARAQYTLFRNRPLTILGYSYGAALAAVVYLSLRGETPRENDRIICFGSPRWGNSTQESHPVVGFPTLFSTIGDPVPTLPPQGWAQRLIQPPILGVSNAPSYQHNAFQYLLLGRAGTEIFNDTGALREELANMYQLLTTGLPFTNHRLLDYAAAISPWVGPVVNRYNSGIWSDYPSLVQLSADLARIGH